ncbi:TPA: hypothetical protein ACOTHO_001394 [Clostridium perfringens]|uniref:hypothetical protein n=1 Tax=Clostridium perfringens TaxID=1502 RepID=UPI000D93F420|nr:hypothetical protein [Clostridium perfringens]MDK0805256.1 hypothetical protein [Clostridium perfringens]MDM0618341.1 hypothetical protein [Clostridium perfringens]NGU53609.1 hypothetical protein [Clostridium perfringens]PWW83890.1 hypothetical protein CYK87_12095 [Clostridium perfringens]PWX27524.1 hypothetical protein CYK95_07300 [Clostridium perfringens]
MATKKQYYIPKTIKALIENELEVCPQNDYLIKKLISLDKINKQLTKSIESCKDEKTIISLSNTINGNMKSIIATLNCLIYKELDDDIYSID